MTSYHFYLRLNGETRRVTYQTFMAYVYGNLVGDMKRTFGEAPKQPALGIECLSKQWFKRKPTAIITSVQLLLRFDNKGNGNTTVHSAILSIEYKGETIDDAAKLLRLNIPLAPGTSNQAALTFNIPIKRVEIKETIERATLTVKHTHGQDEIEVKNIKERPNQ